jgi:hypothetical protein
MLRAFRALPVGLIAVLATACGGGGDPGPGPLSHHLDDMHLAKVPIPEQQEVIQARNDWSVSKMERAKAEADYNDSSTKLTIAKNERKQALLDEKSAQAKLDNAEKSADMNRINSAKRERRAAEMARKAADYKVDTWVAWRRYLKKHLRYAEENVYAAEAKYELAKATLAKEKNIRPRGFDFKAFQKQSAERSRRAQKAKKIADDYKSRAGAEKQKWKNLEKEAAKLRAGEPTSSGTGTQQ